MSNGQAGVLTADYRSAGFWDRCFGASVHRDNKEGSAVDSWTLVPLSETTQYTLDDSLSTENLSSEQNLRRLLHDDMVEI